MPTVKKLQQAIKGYKSIHCPAYSKMKKAELERFVRDQKIPMNAVTERAMVPYVPPIKPKPKPKRGKTKPPPKRVPSYKPASKPAPKSTSGKNDNAPSEKWWWMKNVAKSKAPQSMGGDVRAEKFQNKRYDHSKVQTF